MAEHTSPTEDQPTIQPPEATEGEMDPLCVVLAKMIRIIQETEGGDNAETQPAA